MLGLRVVAPLQLVKPCTIDMLFWIHNLYIFRISLSTKNIDMRTRFFSFFTRCSKKRCMEWDCSERESVANLAGCLAVLRSSFILYNNNNNNKIWKTNSCLPFVYCTWWHNDECVRAWIRFTFFLKQFHLVCTTICWHERFNFASGLCFFDFQIEQISLVFLGKPMSIVLYARCLQQSLFSFYFFKAHSNQTRIRGVPALSLSDIVKCEDFISFSLLKIFNLNWSLLLFLLLRADDLCSMSLNFNSFTKSLMKSDFIETGMHVLACWLTGWLTGKL